MADGYVKEIFRCLVSITRHLSRAVPKTFCSVPRHNSCYCGSDVVSVENWWHTYRVLADSKFNSCRNCAAPAELCLMMVGSKFERIVPAVGVQGPVIHSIFKFCSFPVRTVVNV